MNRLNARKLAETITNEELKAMFDRAKEEIKDWTLVALVNKSMTKGAAWNILAKNFDVNVEHHILVKANMIREFGDYLPGELKPARKSKKTYMTPVHQDPIFN